MSYKIVPLTQEFVDGAVDVLRDSFFPDEMVCRCVGILTDSPVVESKSKYRRTIGSTELENLAVDTVKDGVSLIAVDEKSNKVVGVAFNKIQVKPAPGQLSYFEKFAQENIHDPSALCLVDFMINVDSRLDLFEHFGAHCSLELMFLAVKSSSKGQGIGQALTEATIKIGREYTRTPKPSFVNAIFTSAFSQKSGKRAGMEVLLEVPYTEFEFKGRKYSEVAGVQHPFSALSAIKIS